jgi:hypothetical protein
MTDDIVTRLRNYDFLRDGDYPEVWMTEAADEIERLRTDRDKWKYLFIEMYEKDGTTDDMMHAYRKEKQ